MSSPLNKTNQLLEKLLELHLQGLSQYIDLPRVVLLGSSDSAKQSVIMALTGLPMPKEYLGNDFTMEFIIIPSDKISIKMSVIPQPFTHLGSGRTQSNSERILALKDEVSSNDPDWEGLFEFLFGRIIMELRTVGEYSFSVGDVLRLEIRRPSPGPMVILDIPRLPWRESTCKGHLWTISQIQKTRNTIIVAHDDLSTLKLSRLDSTYQSQSQLCGGRNRTMAIFVANAACLTTRDAPQVRAVVQKRCRGHDFSFGWFVLEDRQGKVRDSFNFQPIHSITDSIRSSYQSVNFFNHVKSKLEQDEILNAPEILDEVEKTIHIVAKKHKISEKRIIAIESDSLKKSMDCLKTAFVALCSFDQQNPTQPPSSASSTTEPMYTPTESLADETELHDPSERTSTPTPGRG